MAVPYRKRSERGLMAAVGRILYEIRYPTTRRGKIIAGALVGLAFTFLSLVVFGFFLLARIVTPPRAGESLDLTQLLGTTQAMTFTTPDGLSHNGWFFPGVRGGAVIILVHGYRSTRSEILTLASSLQEPRYNVFTFNLAGHGESPVSRTTLGYEETQELLAALEELARRPDVDSNRIGIWGHSLGAYAALAASQRFPGVKALILDSVYARPEDMLRVELRRLGANWVPLLSAVTRLEFKLYTWGSRGNDSATEGQRVGAIPKMFLAGNDQPALAALTRQVYERAPEPKQLVTLPRTASPALGGEERSDYENQIISFFLTNLPPVAR